MCVIKVINASVIETIFENVSIRPYTVIKSCPQWCSPKNRNGAPERSGRILGTKRLNQNIRNINNGRVLFASWPGRTGQGRPGPRSVLFVFAQKKSASNVHGKITILSW